MSKLLTQAWEAALGAFIHAAEQGWVPDFVVRAGIVYLLSLRASDVSWGATPSSIACAPPRGARGVRDAALER